MPVPRGPCRGRSGHIRPLACTQPSHDAAEEVAETSGRSSGGGGDINGQLAEVKRRTALSTYAWTLQTACPVVAGLVAALQVSASLLCASTFGKLE